MQLYLAWSMEQGTLFQLRNLLNRRNISTSVKSNVNAWEDFLNVVTKCHIVPAVLDKLGMTSVNDFPNPSIIMPMSGWKMTVIGGKNYWK